MLRSSSGSSLGAGGNNLRFDLAMVGYRGTRSAILSQGRKDCYMWVMYL